MRPPVFKPNAPVIREAIANAVKHRSYTRHNPIQIIRHSNRIQVRNARHSLTTEPLGDEETKVLIYARATGTVDNTACRDFSGLDTLTASRVLRRLRDKGLLDKQGGGNSTYYTLSSRAQKLAMLAEPAMPAIEGCKPSIEGYKSDIEGLPVEQVLAGLLQRLPTELSEEVARLRGKRQTKTEFSALLVRVCSDDFFSIQELEMLFGKHRNYLMAEYIRPLVRTGQLQLRYPESAKHPHQAYMAGDVFESMDEDSGQ